MAKPSHVCALFLGMAALFTVVNAVAVTNTTNWRYRGYTMVSNVAGYLNMTLDYCDIKAAVASGNWARALQIYSEGKNSQGSTSLRKFMTWSLAAHPGEPTYDLLLAYHKNATWLDTAIRTAAAQQKASQFLGLVSTAIHFKYFFHEVDAAYNKTSNNDNDRLEGAPHNLDEAWSLFAGAHPDQCDSLLLLADRLAGDMGTTYYGYSPINLAITNILNDIQYYGLIGKSALAQFGSARQALRVQVAALMAQGFLRESYAAYVGGVCKSSATTASARDLAVAYWFSLAPQLVSFGAKPADLAKVAAAISTPTVNYQQVANALGAVLGPVQIKTLGQPVFSKINTVRNCKLN